MYRNRHLGCFLCKYVDPLRACCPAPLQECTFFPLLFPIATHLTFLPFGQAVTSARHEELCWPPACCCNLGAQGCVACSALAWPFYFCAWPAPLACCVSPVIFSFTGAFLTAYQRYKIIKAYGIDDDHLDDYFGDHVGSDGASSPSTASAAPARPGTRTSSCRRCAPSATRRRRATSS